jgi:hypothetical protein
MHQILSGRILRKSYKVKVYRQDVRSPQKTQLEQLFASRSGQSPYCKTTGCWRQERGMMCKADKHPVICFLHFLHLGFTSASPVLRNAFDDARLKMLRKVPSKPHENMLPQPAEIQ